TSRNSFGSLDARAREPWKDSFTQLVGQTRKARHRLLERACWRGILREDRPSGTAGDSVGGGRRGRTSDSFGKVLRTASIAMARVIEMRSLCYGRVELKFPIWGEKVPVLEKQKLDLP